MEYIKSQISKRTVGHDETDIWIEANDGINYVLPNAYLEFEGGDIIDFTHTILSRVKGWTEEDNGCKTAIY